MDKDKSPQKEIEDQAKELTVEELTAEIKRLEKKRADLCIDGSDKGDPYYRE